MSYDLDPVAPQGAVLAEEVAGLRLVGWTHHDSSLQVLEHVAVPRQSRPGLLQRLSEAGLADVVVLSTCSRTEIYSGGPGRADVTSALAGTGQGRLPEPGLVCSGVDVAAHLLRVAAGLDSRVVGEVEIREQVRAALREAHGAGAAGMTLTRLFAAALRSAARVQQQTGLGAQSRSLSHRAVDLGLAELPSRDAPFVLVIGAGRMARSAVEHLARRGVRARVAARDATAAARLVGVRRVCPLGALQVGIAHADLVLCATSASSFVVTAPHVRRAMQTRSTPLTVVDLAVPRNVEATVAAIPGVRLIDLSQLHDDAGSDPEFAGAVRAARELVRLEEHRYLRDASARTAAPVIGEMRRRVEQLCLAELVRRGRPGLDEAQAAAMARSLSGKLLHGPTLAARAAAEQGDDALLQQLQSLFADPSAPQQSSAGG